MLDFKLGVGSKIKKYDSNLENNSDYSESSNQIRKAIQRELEPFIFSAKNELKLIIENFNKDLGVYKYLQSDNNIVKEAVQENKKMILIFQEEIEKKFNSYAEKFHGVNMKFENLKETITDHTKKVKNFDKMYETMQEGTFGLESLKEKISSIENREEKLFETIKESMQSDFSHNLKSLEKDLEILKQNQNSYDSGISELKIKQSQMNNHYDQINLFHKSFKDELENLSEKIRSFNSQSSNTQKKFENINSNNSSIVEKISGLKEQLSSIRDDINTLKFSQDNLKTLVKEIEDMQQNDKENSSAFNSNILNKIKNEIEILSNDVKSIKEKINKFNDKLLSSKENVNLNISDQLVKLSDENKKLSKKNEEKIIKINEDLLNINSNLNDLTLNYNSLKSEIGNNRLNIKNERSPSEQARINEIFEKSLSGLVKQIVNISSDVENLKLENQRSDENFELIQDNFEKLNFEKFEKNQKLQNEIIKTFVENYENLKKNIETQFMEFEKMKKILNDDIKKLNEKNGQNINIDSIEAIVDYKIKTSIENQDKLNSNYKIDNTAINILNEKVQENEEKINKIFNYFDPKIEELTEYLNLILSKYNTNSELNLPASQHINEVQSHAIQVYTSGFVTNIHGNFSLKHGGLIKEKLSDFIPKNYYQTKIDQNLYSIKNNIDIKKDKKIYYEKFQKNLIYISCNPMFFSEIKSNFKGYLNKHIILNKNYANVIEGDFDMEQADLCIKKPTMLSSKSKQTILNDCEAIDWDNDEYDFEEIDTHKSES
jgi:exonuclease SbcC